MEQNVVGDLSVPVLASRANLSPRTLQRRFTAATGLSPRRCVQELRIEKARGLLERTMRSVGETGWAVGYCGPSVFSRLLHATCGISASAYRRRFAIG